MTQKSTKFLLPKQTKHAFTLVEIMFATVLLGIVGIALTALMMDSARGMLWSVNKSQITSDFRRFTGRISQDALNASHAYLYNNFNAASFAASIGPGFSGDCLVLVSTEPLPTDINSQRYYQRIVVYYRNAGGEQDRPVFRTQIVFPVPDDGSGTPTTTRIEDFLAAQINNFDPPERVIDRFIGLTGDRLFNCVTDETFMINGEIIHGRNAQQVTNTYNLTISTRG